MQTLTMVLGVAAAGSMVVAIAFLVRKFQPRRGLATLFAPKSVKRLGVVEEIAIDGKRRLLLLRRDDIEHLVLTGGPVDLLIEAGIAPTANAARTLRTDAGPTVVRGRVAGT